MTRQLIYVFDPLCGWCYGFSPVISALHAKYGAEIPFEIYSGGMVTGDRVQPVAAMAGYIKGAYQRVEALSGVTFGQGYLDMLDAGTYISNSAPPSAAIQVARTLDPARVIPFAHDLQQAMFVRGQDLNDPDTYRQLALTYGWDPEDFVTQWQSVEIQHRTQAEFEMVAGWGVSGFPTLLYAENEQLFLVANGFRSQQDLEPVMQQILARTA
ncbi:MAG: DsbA family protein [Bacteroidia bacterium]|nr:DsbA family protein [Bacteroidia bacterium]